MDKILQYQKLDIELHKLIRATENCEEKAVMNKMIAYVKDAQNKSIAIESGAKKVVDDYKDLRAKYDDNYKKVQTLTSNSDYKNIDYKSAYAQINALSSELFMIERNLNIVINKAKELLKSFEVTKNNVLKARSKHKESKDKYEALVANYQPKIEAARKEMKKLEKEVDQALLEKYRAIKNDKVFPVFVSLDGKLCGGCRMEIASGTLNKLSTNKFITCEHCGRVIFKK